MISPYELLIKGKNNLRNVANSGIRRAKADYVLSQLDTRSKDSSKFWKELKEVFPTKKVKGDKTKIQLIDEVTAVPIAETDKADYINEYFVNVGNPPAGSPLNQTKSSTNKHSKNARKTHKRRTNPHFPVSPQPPAQVDEPLWTIPTFTEQEVIQVLQSIEPKKSSGLPHISNVALKPVLKILAEQMTFISNLSVKTQTFPESWKKALVIPIPKKGDLSSVTNFRPISLLPQPGKVLEKLVHNSLTQFIEENMLLSHSQHGFRKNKSTLDALYQLTSTINTNMDSKRPTLVTFLDFKKAFDCVQHDLLLKKMKCLNIDDGTLGWLENYLTNRQQQVLANDIWSNTLPISQGVPQGSIIGPLMYIIFANDITKVLKHNHVTLYADDTVLYSRCRTLNEAHKRMQKDLNALQKWCKINGIFVNVSKTKYMIFGSKVTLAKYNTPDDYLKIGQQPIDRVRNYCYLGVMLDEQLNYEMHAINVIKRVKCKLVQLRRMKYCLNKQGALFFFFFFFYSVNLKYSIQTSA